MHRLSVFWIFVILALALPGCGPVDDGLALEAQAARASNLATAAAPAGAEAAGAEAAGAETPANPAESAAAGSAELPQVAPESCPVTQPPNPPFVPPPPAGAPEAGEFWYGTPALWTMLRLDGTWTDLPYNETGYSQKVFWWREGYEWRAEPEPELAVRGRRLDGEAPPLAASKATNGFHEDLKSFMLVGVDIPTAGCWEITGRYAGQELSFVVWVAP